MGLKIQKGTAFVGEYFVHDLPPLYFSTGYVYVLRRKDTTDFHFVQNNFAETIPFFFILCYNNKVCKMVCCKGRIVYVQ